MSNFIPWPKYGRAFTDRTAGIPGRIRPFLPNTDFIEFKYVKDLQTKINGQTLGVILEFIQGEGGVNVISKNLCRS